MYFFFFSETKRLDVFFEIVFNSQIMQPLFPENVLGNIIFGVIITNLSIYSKYITLYVCR